MNEVLWALLHALAQEHDARTGHDIYVGGEHLAALAKKCQICMFMRDAWIELEKAKPV